MTTIPSNGYSQSTGRSTNSRVRRPLQGPPVQQQPKKSILRAPARAPLTNKAKDFQTRYGQNPHKNFMHSNTPSNLRRRRFDELDIDAFTDPLYSWDQPSDLNELPIRTMSSPMRTPPRLRALMSSPGIGYYRNSLNLRRGYSPLPGIDLTVPTVNLDSWGLSPYEYRMNPIFPLSRPQPSPLTRYGLPKDGVKPKKSYIVVPTLNNFASPRIQSDPNYSVGFSSTPTYIPRIHSFIGPNYLDKPSDYVHNHPDDSLAKTMGEVDRERKNKKKYLEQHYEDLHRRVNQLPASDDHLFSDDWLNEIDNQTNPDASTGRLTNRLNYRDLPADSQNRLLTDVNQEFIDFEVANMARELSNQMFEERMARIHKLTNRQGPDARTRRGPNRFDQKQTQAIDEAVDNHLLDALHMNNLIAKYLRQNGSKVDVNDLSRLLDGTMLDNLVKRYQTVEEHRTLDNYASKKFHANTFMNAAMDLLLTELSASLIEDMKDLDEEQRKFF